MKNNKKRILTIAIVAGAIAPLAYSQATGALSGAVNSATAAATSAQAATAANAAAQSAAQTAAGAAATAPAAAVAGNIGATAAGSATAGTANPGVAVGIDGAAQASTEGQVAGLTVAGVATQSASATLDSETMVELIRSTAIGTRDRVMAVVDARIEATGETMAEVRARGDGLQGEARQRFDAAVSEAHEKEGELRASVRRARAAGQRNFAEARDRLAADYEAYAEAIVNVEAVAQTGSGE